MTHTSNTSSGESDERALQYLEALDCLNSVMRAASHVLVGLPPSEKEAKLRDVLSKAHDWYMAERAALATQPAESKACDSVGVDEALESLDNSIQAHEEQKHSVMHVADVKWHAESIRAALASPAQAPAARHLAVTTDEQGRCVAVTWQDDEGRILEVVWEAPAAPARQHETLGYALAMRVMQSDLYHREMDDRERAECDELIRIGQAPAATEAPSGRKITDEALAEEMADAECDENESSWKYLGRAERNSWLAAARRARELLKGGS